MKTHPVRARTAFLTPIRPLISTFRLDSRPRVTHKAPQICARPRVSMSAFPPDTECPLPQPKIPSSPMDPKVGTQTALTQAARVDPEQESTWLESILSSRVSLSDDHPLNILREAAEKHFNDMVIPGRKMESWRFTDLASVYSSRYVPFTTTQHSEFGVSDIRHFVPDTAGIVLVFIDGIYNQRLSILNDDSGNEWLAEGGYFGSVVDYKGDMSRVTKLLMDAELGPNQGGLFPIIGNSLCNDAVVLHVPASFSVSRPVAVLNLYSGGPQEGLSTVCAPRLVVIAEQRSKLVLLESHGALTDSYGLALPGSAIHVGDNASVSHYLVNDLGSSAQLISNVHASVFRSGSYDVRHIGVGGALGRFTIGIDLKEPEAHGLCHGVIVSTEDQVIDLHSRICHDAVHTTSNQLQKNIAADRSRAIFNGKIVVTKNGDHTNSEQLCKSLLLSKRAGIDAMPVLEIATDDVKCTHGATVADLEDDQVFYCQSRGLSLEQAQFLLVVGFAREVFGDCPFPTVLEQLNRRVQNLPNTRLHRELDLEQMSSI